MWHILFESIRIVRLYSLNPRLGINLKVDLDFLFSKSLHNDFFLQFHSPVIPVINIAFRRLSGSQPPLAHARSDKSRRPRSLGTGPMPNNEFFSIDVGQFIA